jgi:hypothetical protein
VIGGNILNTRTEGGLKHHGDEHLGEKIGRRGAEKRKKKDEDRAAEESLKRLLGRDGIQHSTGGKYLAQLGVDVGKSKGKGEKNGEEKEEVSRAFSAKRIKAIGFDPTIGVGQRRPGDKARRVRQDHRMAFGRANGQAEAIDMLKRPDQGSKLGKPAGMGFSSVKAPTQPVAKQPPASASVKPHGPAIEDDEDMVDLD